MTLSFYPDTDASALADAARKAFAAAGDPIKAIDGLEVLTAVGRGISLELAAVIVTEGAFADIDYPLPAAFAVATLLDLGDDKPAGAAELRASLGEPGEAGDVLAPVPLDTRYVAALCNEDSYLLEPAPQSKGAVDPLKSSPWQRLEVTGPRLPHDLRPIAWTLLAAEILGAATAVFDRHVDHLKTRRQFGQPLGSFQTLRHRAAEDWVRLEDMRVAIDMACVLHDSGAPAEETLAAARIAKAVASDFGPRIAENALHAHGAMGFTEEAGLHSFLIRIRHASSNLSTADEHFRAAGSHYMSRSSEDRLLP